MASPTILAAEADRLAATPLPRVPKAAGYEALNAREGEGAARVSATY
jgi:hypothetical protein